MEFDVHGRIRLNYMSKDGSRVLKGTVIRRDMESRRVLMKHKRHLAWVDMKNIAAAVKDK